MSAFAKSKNAMFPPRSCDTFAVLRPGTIDDCVVFGKNSDRPSGEVQEVVHIPAADYSLPLKIRCTYIEIDQVPHTYAVILSKPSWMWGAEMGSNEHSVCIGNEAVWTTLNDASDGEEKLLGMDLLRLGLERSKTAHEAVQVITSLIAKYGMGGNCSDTLPDFTYHNSFLIADPSEVWILECAGTIWAAERVVEGVRNISNELSIRNNIHLKCDNLEEFSKEKGLWNPSRDAFDFKRAFDIDDFDSPRYKAGKRLLTNLSANGEFTATDMFKVLRDKPSGICMSSGSFVSTGSQVSILRKPDSGIPSSHWFTATPDPARSFYKPFIFTDEVEFPDSVVSPVVTDVGAVSSTVDRRHQLHKLHEEYSKRERKGDCSSLRNKYKELELKYVDLAKIYTEEFEKKKVEAGRLFSDAVEEETLILKQD